MFSPPVVPSAEWPSRVACLQLLLLSLDVELRSLVAVAAPEARVAAAAAAVAVATVAVSVVHALGLRHHPREVVAFALDGDLV